MHEDSMETKNLRPNGATLEVKASKSGIVMRLCVLMSLSVCYLTLMFANADSVTVVGKVQNRNGKKREAAVAAWNPPFSGAPPVGSKSQQRSCPPSKQKGPEKQRQRSRAVGGGYGAQHQNDYQVNLILLLTFLSIYPANQTLCFR